MANNNPAGALANIIKNANDFIKAVESGEGLDLPDDKKEEFKKQMKELIK